MVSTYRALRIEGVIATEQSPPLRPAMGAPHRRWPRRSCESGSTILHRLFSCASPNGHSHRDSDEHCKPLHAEARPRAGWGSWWVVAAWKREEVHGATDAEKRASSLLIIYALVRGATTLQKSLRRPCFAAFAPPPQTPPVSGLGFQVIQVFMFTTP